ncbi:MAG: aminopeptidase P family protein [bacterium]|nr:aminopeptidase P family protein [bacterium]
MTALCKRRIATVKRLLKETGKSSALILSSAPVAIKSRDTTYKYRPDSNLFYLTGTEGKSISLIISSTLKNPILFVPPIDSHTVTWEGNSPNYKKLAKSLGADLIQSKNCIHEIKNHLKGHETLFHQNAPQADSWKVAFDLMSSSYSTRANLPSEFVHCDKLLEELRLYKDSSEIQFIKYAATITNNALFDTVPFISQAGVESDIATTIDYLFKVQGSESSFNTIVACGPSAAVLHYEEQNKKIKSGEMLLIDCGAVYEMYAADISRTLPVSGHFTPIQNEIYSIVLESQEAAIKLVKNGNQIQQVYNAAAKVITEGLVHLGILKGKTSKLMQTGAFKPYFMHSIGHTLGLDVHDLGNLRDRQNGELKSGMVITIEPGLYFQKKTKNIPICGVRIEDDVLVKTGKPEILSEGFPKSIAEIEELMNA